MITWIRRRYMDTPWLTAGEDSVRSPESRAPATPSQNGELLPQGEIFESLFRPRLQRSKNQGKQSQNRQHHGRRVSDSMVNEVNFINQAEVLAIDWPTAANLRLG